MTDTPPERRPTGEQPHVCIKTNGGPTWRWFVGALLALITGGGGGYVSMRVNQAVLAEKVDSHEKTATRENSLQDGVIARLARESRAFREALHRIEVRQAAMASKTIRERFPVPPLPPPLKPERDP